MQGAIVMWIALSGLGCHHKSCDAACARRATGLAAAIAVATQSSTRRWLNRLAIAAATLIVTAAIMAALAQATRATAGGLRPAVTSAATRAERWAAAAAGSLETAR